MGKDPCFNFYVGDWQGGTVMFNRHQKGCYIDLMVAQFNNWSLSMSDILDVLGQDDFDKHWEYRLRSKFKTEEIDGVTKYYNERLREEINKRRKYSQSRSENRAGNKTEIKSTIQPRVKNFENVTSWDNCNLYSWGELSDELKSMYDEDTWNRWKAFNRHIDENLSNIRKVQEQIKIHEYVRLKKDYIDSKKISVDNFFLRLTAFDNYNGIEKKYVSVYKAFDGWLRRN